MNSISPLLRVPFRYGLLGGVIGSIVIAVLFFSGQHPFLLPVIFDFRIIVFAVFIFFSLREVRDYHLRGVLFFWQGIVGSYVVIFTSALVGSLFTLSLGEWSSTFLSSYVEKERQEMMNYKDQIISSVGADAYNQQLNKLPLTSSWDLASDYFLKSIIIGLFLAILISVFVRKQPKTN
jgi:hypothetical protein